jgi:fermentation-respiration switch protein FrsA (DUF1100 family)
MPPFLSHLLGILAMLIALVLIAAWLLAGQIVRRRKPDPPLTPEDFDLPFDHVTFTARDGVELGGRFVGEPGRRPTVILCAGMFGSMDGDAHMLPAFIEAGFDVLQFDWRGHGISDGQRNTLSIREASDLLGAIDFLQAEGVTRIGLMGFSMGGTVALRVAAADRRVGCVVCDGGFVDIGHVLEGFIAGRTRLPVALLRPAMWLVMRLVELRLGARLAQANPLPHVGRISPRPVLFIHGADDPLVPPADQDALFAACGEPKALWRVTGAGHREAYQVEREAYLQHVTDFLRANLT